jgi:hypothetical protein
MIVELNDEMLDEAILKTLKWHRKNAKREIKRLIKLSEKQVLEPYQQGDLDNFTRTKIALDEVYDYFGGNLKNANRKNTQQTNL